MSSFPFCPSFSTSSCLPIIYTIICTSRCVPLALSKHNHNIRSHDDLCLVYGTIVSWYNHIMDRVHNKNYLCKTDLSFIVPILKVQPPVSSFSLTFYLR